MLCILASCLRAQSISRSYDRVPLTDALKELDRRQNDYDISFIYDDLRDFIITANVKAKNVPDAIRQIIGFPAGHGHNTHGNGHQSAERSGDR